MATPPDRHVVVFDCNIYLDIAHIVGAPFTWEAFDREAARLACEPVPHPTDRAYDSLRAVAVTQSGRFAGRGTLEVWSSEHIHKVVEDKARQSVTPDPTTGYRGLGWAPSDAHGLVTDLVDTLLDWTGGLVIDTFTDGHPPLDYEDGMVFGTCAYINECDPVATIYCVTRDRGFLGAAKEGRLSPHTKVLHPSTFVGLVRRARQKASILSMQPSAPPV